MRSNAFILPSPISLPCPAPRTWQCAPRRTSRGPSLWLHSLPVRSLPEC